MQFLQKIDRGRSVCIGGLFVWLALLAGCQSPTVTHEQAQTVLQSRIGIRQQLGITSSQLDAAVAALNEINGKQADDLVAAFNHYSDQIKLLDASIADLDNASAASKAQAQVYFDTAETKIALINDPELKARATTRREKALGLADKIDDDTKSVQQSYDLFLQRLKDIEAYLAADLTSGCVRSIQDQFAQTNADVAPLKSRSNQLSYDLEIANELMNTGELKPATSSTTLAATESTTTVPASTYPAATYPAATYPTAAYPTTTYPGATTLP